MPVDPILTALRDRRVQLGLTQDDIGRACHLTAKVVCRWESGQAIPNLQQVRWYAAAVGWDLELTWIPGWTQEGI